MSTSNGSTALAIAAPQSALARETSHALEPRSFDDGVRFSEMVSKSGMYGVKSKEEAFVRIATGMSLGLDAAASLRAVFLINGRPGVYSDVMMGLCLRSPECDYFRCVETTDTSVTFEAKRRRDPKPTSLTFTLDDAKRAGLLSNAQYQKYPSRMLEARAKAMLARLVFPDLVHGLYSPEELSSGAAAPDAETVYAEVIEQPKAKPVARPSTTDWEVLGVKLETELLMADDADRIDALSKLWSPQFKDAPPEVRKRVAAIFKTSRERIAQIGETPAAE